MPRTSNKSANDTKKTRGRQSHFSGKKLAFLDSLAPEFLIRKDRSAFYGEAAQRLIDQFGYSRDGKVYVEGDSLRPEEKSEYYQALRNVSLHIFLRVVRNTYWSSARNWDSGSDTVTWPSPLTARMLRRS
jgi:hypothetical protein